VLEGKAVVRVVDVVESSSSSPKVVGKLPVPVPAATAARGEREKERTAGGADKCCIVSDILEESMRSLSLGKK
jgi:hypothetical protein